MIKGEKVILRGLLKKDKELIYEWANHKEMRDRTGTVYPVSECEHENWFEKMCCSNDPKIFAVEYKDKCIGTIGLKGMDRVNSVVELFIKIGDDTVKNMGCGTDAVKTLVNYSFGHLNFHKVYLTVYASNEPAIRCYEKAGFIKEGCLKQHHFNNGKYEDVIIMGIIRENGGTQ
ncbi:MAG: GNAT family N-acetyltransferase [Lachnospiraceae bacterium]|nr:GNAT family N-acetyltransferase [Lachnospiraceae bacterium]